jgi:uncharacterized LabA/DUF88 family protein
MKKANDNFRASRPGKAKSAQPTVPSEHDASKGHKSLADSEAINGKREGEATSKGRAELAPEKAAEKANMSKKEAKNSHESAPERANNSADSSFANSLASGATEGMTPSSSEPITERMSEKTSDRTSEKASDKASDRAPEKAPERTVGKTAGKTTSKAAEAPFEAPLLSRTTGEPRSPNGVRQFSPLTETARASSRPQVPKHPTMETLTATVFGNHDDEAAELEAALSTLSDVPARPATGQNGAPIAMTPSNSIRRHTVNRAPNFQSSYSPVYQTSDRIAIFIDGSNLFYAASHLNIEIDYRRLLTTLVRGRRLLRAYFYTGVDPQNEKQRGFLLWLNRHGHRVVSKDLVALPDGSRKANMHVEMAVDMMRTAEYCSTLTLLGGDGNLAYALQVLSQRGTSIEVVSLQSMTSDSLIDLADAYIDLADLKDDIKR